MTGLFSAGCWPVVSVWSRGQSPGKRVTRLRKGTRLLGISMWGRVLALVASKVCSRQIRSFPSQGKPTHQGLG